MRLARPGVTCWRLTRARRLSFLADGEAYFGALDAALRAARRSVHLLGWGFDPRITLTPDRAAADQVGHLLIALAEARPELDVRLLVWRSALPISATQAFFPHRAQAWFRGRRVDFRLDATVPFGACHHQKIVVVDGALAFVGGADLMPGRWDTPAHPDADRRRSLPGRVDPPRHELMAMADGGAAAALDELFAARWRMAVGETPPTPNADCPQLWPDDVAPDLEDVDLAIARTEPSWRGRGGAREIAALTLEAIAAAKRLIYIENQYFTWPLAVEALAARLAEPDGPEVVLIVSEKSPSYFDRITMDRARANALWRLKAGDIFGRFHALTPYSTGGHPIVVHAKAMIVDDVLARISSANLNNRSHGFDTECEIVIEAQNATQRAGIAGVRDRLAAHWVGQTPQALARVRGADGSLADGLFALDLGARLRALTPKRLGPVGEFIADFHLGDPTAVSDSWRLGRRRRRLIDETRALRRSALRPSG
jgi:phosphatidylserine/phosphatidylglycerophosphate/cardiolipin synthase-like enzyme